MCHFEVILEKVTYMVIFNIILILYKYKDKISIFGQLKTGLMLFVTCYLLLSKVLFTNLKSYGPKATVKVMRNSALEQEVASWLAEGSASN